MSPHSSLKQVLILSIAAILIAGATPAPAVDIPDSPDGTVTTVMEALADHHPEVLWQALPTSYQKDITELTHAYAERMDPTVWDTAFGLGRRTAALLRDKKTIILQSASLQAAGDKRQQIEDGWDTSVALLDGFFSSDVSNLDALTTIDWERYLGTTVRDLMIQAAEISRTSDTDAFDRDFVQTLRQTKVEVVSRDESQATLRISPPDEDPEELRMTLVEGRWVPSDMAADWDQEITEAREKLAAITDEEIQQGSMQAMMVVGMIDGALTQLESVETPEEFDQAIQGILGPLMGSFPGSAWSPGTDQGSQETE
jgi:hypothetical protein